MSRPGGEMGRKQLHFIWICDCSGSMQEDGKIQSLNQAIRENIPHMQKAAADNPEAEVYVRALKFADGAQWVIPTAVRIADFRWSDLSADGVTDMGKALSMVAEQLKIPPMPNYALPPVLALISDGQPTDDFASGLKALMAQPWGQRAVRMAIAIGRDADYDCLQKFIGKTEVKPLRADNPEALSRHIKWMSTVVLKAVSNPVSYTDPLPSGDNVVIPVLADTSGGPSTAGGIW